MTNGAPAADDRRIAAMLSGDTAALEEILAEDIVYVHSSGTHEDRALYLARVADGTYRYHAIRMEGRAAQALGPGIVLINEDQHFEATVCGTRRVVASRLLQVWAEREGTWKLVRLHASPVPAS